MKGVPARLVVVCLLLCGVGLATVAEAVASPAGSIDTTYGTSGSLALTDPDAALEGRASTMLADGSMVVAASQGPSGDNLELFHIDTTGAVDPSFERDAFQTVPIDYFGIFAAATAPDGDIVLVGVTQASPDGGEAWLIARFQPDGTMDTDFGSGGVVVTPMPGYASAQDVVVQPDGAIVVGGSAQVEGGDYRGHWTLARYLPDGSLDPSFADGGMAHLPTVDYFGITGVALQPDGAILAAGWITPLVGDQFGGLARFLPNGDADVTFGDGGIVTSTNFLGLTPVLQADGKVLLAGRTVDEAGDGVGIARFDGTGELDPSFGTAGVVELSPPGEGSVGMVGLRSDGSILAAGNVPSPHSTNVFALERLTPDGELDPTFGDGGRMVEDLGYPRIIGVTAGAIQPDGKLVVVQPAEDQQGHGFVVLARFFTSDGPRTDIDAGPDGPVSTPAVSFGFSSPDTAATFICSLDGAAFAPCSSPAAYTGLDDGDHTFRVRAIDAGDNVGPVEARSFFVDTAAPTTTIDTGPSGRVYSADQRFTFSASEPATFECSLDGDDPLACASPHFLTDLGEGSHTFQVRATDDAGNLGSPATRIFDVDLTDVLQPDAAVGVGSGPLAGVGIENITGRHQHVRQQIRRGAVGRFRIEITDAGTLADAFTIDGRSTLPGCSLRYFAGGVDVTTDISNGTFTTATLEPGGSTNLVLRVEVRRTAQLGLRMPVRIAAISLTDPHAKDVVLASVDVSR